MRKKQLIWAALLVTAAASVYGGGSGSAPVSSPSSDSFEAIILQNIQYIPQQLRVGTSYNGLIRHGTVTLMNQHEIDGWENYKNTVIYADFEPNESNLCGVASALMIRSKTAKNTVITPDNELTVNNCLTELAYGLTVGRYGGDQMYEVDVNNTGLLYVYPNWESYPRIDRISVEDQFYITSEIILANLYTAQKKDPALDEIIIDKGGV
jgi:hypothetical protein